MTAVRTMVIADGTIGAEVGCLLLIMIGTFAVSDAILDSIQHAAHGIRALGAVATLGSWSLAGGAAALVSLRAGVRRFRASLVGAVLVVAIFNGLVVYPFLAYATWVNDCSWGVAFPLGERFECGR